MVVTAGVVVVVVVVIGREDTRLLTIMLYTNHYTSPDHTVRMIYYSGKKNVEREKERFM